MATLSTGTTIGGTTAATVNSNVASASKLNTPRTINGVSFDGSADITVTPPAATDSQLGGVKVSLSGTELSISTT